MTTLPLKDVPLRYRKATGKIYFKVSDLLRFPEWPESPLIELIEGDLYLVSSPTPQHQAISSEILYQIKAFLRKNPVGQVFCAPIDVVLSEEDSVIPDITFIGKEQQEIIKEKNIQGAPLWIIEIVSTNRELDYTVKKRLYARFGVKEYWIIDHKKQKIVKYILKKKSSYLAEEFPFTAAIPVSNIKGLSIQLKGLF